MAFVVLFILGVMWAGVGFSWLRSRSEHRSVNSISSFSNHLTVLARTSPARAGLDVVEDRSTNRMPLAPAPGASLRSTPRHQAPVLSLAQARRRRRDILFVLAGCAGLASMLALAVHGIFILMALATVGLLAGYVVLLVRAQRIGIERQQKVRYLPALSSTPAADTSQALLLRRSGS